VTLVTNRPNHPLLQWIKPLPFVSVRTMPPNTPGLELEGKQWVSRLVELQDLPYDVTYAVDAGSLVCHPATLLSAFQEAASDNADFDVAVQTQLRPSTCLYPLGGFIFMRRTQATKGWLADWLHMQMTMDPAHRDDQKAMSATLKNAKFHGRLRVRRLHPRLSGYLRHLQLDSALPSQSRFHDGYIGLIHWTMQWGAEHGQEFLCSTVNAHPEVERYFTLQRQTSGATEAGSLKLQLQEWRDASGCTLEGCDVVPLAHGAPNFLYWGHC
jgi:hypothetical protein